MTAPWKPRRPRLTLQHLASPAAELPALRDALQAVGEQLEMSFELAANRGDVVLLEADLAARIPPHLLTSMADNRPVLLLSGSRAGDGQWPRRGATFERHQQQLLQQLRSLSLVRQQSAPARQSADADADAESSSGWGNEQSAAQPQRGDAEPPRGCDLGFDSAFDQALLNDQPTTESLADVQYELMHTVRRGLLDPNAPVLHASYGVDANLRFDFRQRIVTLDPLAQRQLRVHRELPSPVQGAAPSAEVTVRELAETVWDLVIAGGSHALFDAPADWWHCALAAPAAGAVQRCTRLPRHLALARVLEAGPTTPSQLRRTARVDIDDLRRFPQACLMLGLVHWLPNPVAPTHSVTSGKPQ